MAEKIDMVYDTVCKIDERQRVKAEKDEKRHAIEDARMTTIEIDFKEHKEAYVIDRKILQNLEEKRVIKNKLKSLAVKLVATLTGISSLIYGIMRVIK